MTWPRKFSLAFKTSDPSCEVSIWFIQDECTSFETFSERRLPWRSELQQHSGKKEKPRWEDELFSQRDSVYLFIYLWPGLFTGKRWKKQFSKWDNTEMTRCGRWLPVWRRDERTPAPPPHTTGPAFEFRGRERERERAYRRKCVCCTGPPPCAGRCRCPLRWRGPGCCRSVCVGSDRRRSPPSTETRATSTTTHLSLQHTQNIRSERKSQFYNVIKSLNF